MRKEDIINVEIEKDDLVQAILHAKNSCFIDNLRQRNMFVAFDSKIRGFLGEIAIIKLLIGEGIKIKSVNKINKNENEDVDICVDNGYCHDLIIEVKTSLFPDKWKNIEDLIENADIKIIKREKNFEEIKADFYIQIYYNFYRKERDNFLKGLSGEPADYSVDKLIEMMDLESLHECIVAWKDKKSLLKELASSQNKTWSYSMRSFWKCPLKTSNSPKTFINFIRRYKSE